MKLVEILAKELVEWPDHAYVAVQDDDSDHTIWFLQSDHRDLSFMSGGWECESLFNILINCPSQLAHDHATAIVTRADWEKEKMKKAAPKKNAEGWIRHRGGKCPVDDGTLIDIRCRDGIVKEGVVCGDQFTRTSEMFWIHEGDNAEVMAYRLHKPVEQPVSLKAFTETVDAFGDSHADVMESVLSRLDGPIQWRDRIAEIDATTLALTSERAELVQKLASEGFALIGRVVDTSAKKEEWKRHAEEGRKINAIKHYRELHGSSLRDAKDAVELYQSTLD